jgi:hypothetical protein
VNHSSTSSFNQASIKLQPVPQTTPARAHSLTPREPVPCSHFLLLHKDRTLLQSTAIPLHSSPKQNPKQTRVHPLLHHIKTVHGNNLRSPAHHHHHQFNSEPLLHHETTKAAQINKPTSNPCLSPPSLQSNLQIQNTPSTKITSFLPPPSYRTATGQIGKKKEICNENESRERVKRETRAGKESMETKKKKRKKEKAAEKKQIK